MHSMLGYVFEIVESPVSAAENLSVNPQLVAITTAGTIGVLVAPVTLDSMKTTPMHSERYVTDMDQVEQSITGWDLSTALAYSGWKP